MTKNAIACLALFITASLSSQPRNILYKIEREGFKTGYLFGTMHLVPAEQVLFSENTLKAMQSCDQVIIEANISEANPEEMMRMAQLPNGGRIDTALNAADAQKLDSALVHITGTGLSTFATFKPFFIDALLINTIASGTQNMEAELLEYVEAAHIDIDYLETLAEQFAIFDSLPVRAQLAQTMEFIHSQTNTKQEFDAMSEMYARGDVESLGQMISDEWEDPRFAYCLLEKRNRNWLPIIALRLKEKAVFIAVGTGHLPGDMGLVALLRQAGFEVTRVE